MKILILIIFLVGISFAQSNLLLLFDSETTILNQVSNGGFADATDWDMEPSWVIFNQEARYDAVVTHHLRQAQADMVLGLEINTAYTIEFDVSNGTGDMWLLNYADAIVLIDRNTYATGHHSISFTTPSNIGVGGISFYTFNTGAFYLDNVGIYKQ